MRPTRCGHLRSSVGSTQRGGSIYRAFREASSASLHRRAPLCASPIAKANAAAEAWRTALQSGSTRSSSLPRATRAHATSLAWRATPAASASRRTAATRASTKLHMAASKPVALLCDDPARAAKLASSQRPSRAAKAATRQPRRYGRPPVADSAWPRASDQRPSLAYAMAATCASWLSL